MTLLNAIQLTWTFDLYQGTVQQDIAEFSLWFHYGPGGSAPQSDLDFLAQNGADAWSANVSSSNYATNVKLFTCTARIYDVAGKTLAESVAIPATAWAGSASAGALPWETSLCVSLYTYEPGTFIVNGRRRRGRYYLPPMSVAVMEAGTSGFVQNAMITGLLAEQKAFYGHLYAGAFPGTLVVIPVVYSRKDEDLYITQYLVMDAKLDSQRRRENRETAGRIQTPIS